MWVQLLITRQIEVSGRTRTYHPGDWVDIGKQTALRWCADGIARAADVRALELSGCGVIVADAAQRERSSPGDWLRSIAPGVEIAAPGDDALPFPRTLLWDGGVLRPELLGVGFRLLEKWEMAAPLWSYDQLASAIGSEAERERTRAVVRELRVPVYHTGLVFVRRCPTTRELMVAWAEEREGSREDKLAFLRAMYRVKPLLCALPPTWVKR